MSSSFESIDELVKSPVPPVLWHYTSVHSFIPILRSGTLYATHFRFTNDAREVIHARDRSLKILREKHGPDNAVVEEFKRVYLKALKTPSITYYLTSFAESKNQLSQWRGYSHGSSGVSLGFDLRSLKKDQGTNLEGRNLEFGPCVYNNDVQEKMIQATLQPLLGNLRGVNEFTVLATATRMLRLTPFLKHNGFGEENEWRCVQTLKQEAVPNFRAGKTAVIPHTELPVGKYLTNVLLGPGSARNAKVGADLFLKSQGYSIKAELSEVPYLPR